MKKRFFLCFLALLLTLSFALPVSADELSPDEIIRDILAAQMEKEGVSDTKAYLDRLTDTPDDGREWYAFALMRGDESLDFSAYAEALNRSLSEKAPANAVTKQKFATVLLASGFTSDFVEKTRTDAAGKLGTMSYIFALHLEHNLGNKEKAASLIASLLSLRRADGGFSVTGEVSDPDVTAMAIQALAPYYDTDENAKNAVDTALLRLSELQTERGGFVSYGVENPESTAQVLTALCALGIEPTEDPRFVKNGNTLYDAILMFRLADGTFSHSLGENASENANMQVLLAMTALTRFREGKTGLYEFETDGALVRLESEKSKTPTKETGSYKLVLLVIILAASALISLVLFLMKKRRPAHYFTVIITAIVLILIVFFLELEAPDSYYGTAAPKENIVGEVTLSITCRDILGMSDADYIPKDGVILPPTVFEIEENATVFSVLEEAAKTHRIQMETGGTGDLVYIEGMNYLYEMGFGDLSGWIYFVNGASASKGCGTYKVKDGDEIVWEYSLDLK